MTKVNKKGLIHYDSGLHVHSFPQHRPPVNLQSHPFHYLSKFDQTSAGFLAIVWRSNGDESRKRHAHPHPRKLQTLYRSPPTS